MSSDTLSPSESMGTLGIVGVGLLGGSIAAAAKKRVLAQRIIGIGRNAERLQRASDGGLLDSYSTELSQAAEECDVLVFCTPVNRIIEGVRTAAASCRSGTLITDVGSCKAGICQSLSAELPSNVSFVGSHPIAGSEKQGFEHAKEELFSGSVCVVTPTARQLEMPSFDAQLSRTTRFWQALGATVIQMSPEAHDLALAETSHLPHVVAAALSRALDSENRQLAATGFRDTTRIAAGDPDLWLAILQDNRDAVLQSLARFREQLDSFQESLQNRDVEGLKKLLEDAKTSRDGLN
ncbi:MAG: prephenate dehydrogenase [Planctomycetaceae bacterium]|nr:prephenate dehydrogenase [Planctomycetaceae bacterium]